MGFRDMMSSSPRAALGAGQACRLPLCGFLLRQGKLPPTPPTGSIPVKTNDAFDRQIICRPSGGCSEGAGRAHAPARQRFPPCVWTSAMTICPVQNRVSNSPPSFLPMCRHRGIQEFRCLSRRALMGATTGGDGKFAESQTSAFLDFCLQSTGVESQCSQAVGEQHFVPLANRRQGKAREQEGKIADFKVMELR